MERLALAYRNRAKRADEIAEIEAECILPALIAPYVESDQTSNRLFDILDGRQFKIVSTPDDAKADLIDNNADLQAENDALKAKLAQLEGDGLDEVAEEVEPETETA